MFAYGRELNIDWTILKFLCYLQFTQTVRENLIFLWGLEEVSPRTIP